jgi:hypothetical protein
MRVDPKVRNPLARSASKSIPAQNGPKHFDLKERVMSIALTHPAAVASTGSATTKRRPIEGSSVVIGALTAAGIVGMVLVMAFGGTSKPLSYEFSDDAAPVAASTK